MKTRPFDAANYLNDEEDISAYLQVVMEDGERAPSSDTLFQVMRALGFKLTVQPLAPN